MKKKHTRIIVLLAAVAVLILLFVLFRFLPGWLDTGRAPDDTSSVEPTVYIITDKVYTDIRTLTYTAGGETMCFSRDGETGQWTYLDDPQFPLLADPLDKMASYISTLTADRRLDGDTGAYGFAEPALTVEATFADGTAVSLVEGAYNTFADKSYLLAGGEVYLVSSMLRQCFSVPLESMIALDTLPAELTERSIRSMLLRSADGKKEKLIDDENGVLLVMDASTYVFPLTSWILPHVTDAELAALGITDASASLTVTYEAEVSPSPEIAPETKLLSFTYRFGDAIPVETESGEPGEDAVPFTIGDSTIVYVMKASLLDDLWAFFDYEAPAKPELEL